MTKDKALKMALEALEENHEEIVHNWALFEKNKNAILAIKEALEQPEREPVADAYALADKVRQALDRQSCPDAFMRAAWEAVVNNYTTPPQHKPLTDEMVVAGARVLNERQADACGVDRDDQWAIYSDDFKADARAMLEAAHGIKE
jgi:hypothetical protein